MSGIYIPQSAGRPVGKGSKAYDAYAKGADLESPHTVADDHGDPEELLAKLNEAEGQAAALRDQLKSILAEALLR